MSRVFVKIFGQVQGVCFRDFIYRNATALDLAGWIRNIDDGTVEAIFEGEKGKLKKMIKLCHQGPLFARIDKINERWGKATGEFKRFVIEY